jgi:hypothetical protein
MGREAKSEAMKNRKNGKRRDVEEILEGQASLLLCPLTTSRCTVENR